jgi:hypothetical protein
MPFVSLPQLQPVVFVSLHQMAVVIEDLTIF